MAILIFILFHCLDVKNSGRDITARIQDSVGERLGNGTMSFDNLADFIAMGGHGVFVWSCYGIVIAALIINIFQPIQAARKFRTAQQNLIQQQAQHPSSTEESPTTTTTLT